MRNAQPYLEHASVCGFCWKLRRTFAKAVVRCGESTRLQCWYCRSIDEDQWNERFDWWRSQEWMIYPCGWWEPHPLICECVYFDRLRNELMLSDAFCIVPRSVPWPEGEMLRKVATNLRIEGFLEHHVEFSWSMTTKSFVLEDANERKALLALRHPNADSAVVYIGDIISMKPFRSLYHSAKNFNTYIMPKVYILRDNIMVVSFLRLLEIMRFQRCNRTIYQLILSCIRTQVEVGNQLLEQLAS